MRRSSIIKSGTLSIYKAFLSFAFLFLAVFTFNLNDAKAVDEQAFDFAITYGGPGTGFNAAEPYNLITDEDGNIYMAGSFQNVIDFDPGPGIVQFTATSTSDLYVQKLDPDGNLIWVKHFPSTAPGSWINSVGLDSSGNIFGTGYFRGTIDFDPGAGSFPLTALGANQNDTFVFKLDSDGEFVWATQHSGLYQDQGEKIVIGPDDSVYVAGYFAGTVDFDPGAGVYNISSLGTVNRDGFIFKLDNDGNLIWANAYQSTTDVSDHAYDMDIDGNGDILVTGNFSGTLDFDFGAGSQELIGSSFDMFMHKFDEDGNFIWVKVVYSDNVVVPNVFEVSGDGDVFIAGAYSGTADFDPGPGNFNITGTSVRFMMKLDSSGNFEWVKEFGDSIAPRWTGLKSDSDGDIYGFGRITATRDMDPGAGTVNVDPNSGRVFLLKLSGDGVFEWVKQFTGGATNAIADDLYIDRDDNIFVSGDFAGTGDFDPGAGTYEITDLNTTGPYDAFMVKLSAPVPVMTPPAVTTSAASGVAVSDATLNGEITDIGTQAPTERGFEYGLTIAYGDTVSELGSFGAGVFSQSLSGLTCNTLYHYRAFASSADGTGNGSDATFTTATCPVAPAVTTAAASAITATGVTLNGEIVSEGTSSPTERGFEYGLNVLYGATASEPGLFTAGSFTQSLTGLTCATTYHYRAFATSADGEGNGSDVTFTTSACPVSGGSSGSKPRYDEVEDGEAVTPPSTPAPTNQTSEEQAPTNNSNVPVANSVVGSPVAEQSSQPESAPLATESWSVPVRTQPQTTPDPGTGYAANVDRVLGERLNPRGLLLLQIVGLGMLFALLPIVSSSSIFSLLGAAIPLGVSGLRLVYQRYFSNLYSIPGFRKKRRIWGTVYDSQTKQPLDPAIVELIDVSTGKVVDRAITDLAGRFGFIAAQGQFTLRASKTHYSFPSEKETGSTDEIFDNLYHGEQFSLTEQSTLITPNIPMDPVAYDWNQDAKQKLLPSRLRWQYIAQVLFNLVFVAGFIFSIYNIFTYPGWWNYFIFALYILVLIIRYLIGYRHLWGRLLKDGKPLPGMKLVLSEKQMGVIMGRALTAQDGKFFLKTPEAGEYNLAIKNPQGEIIYTGTASVGKENVFNEEINIW